MKTYDGYAVVRRSTLAWLLERHREAPECSIPLEIARDLRITSSNLSVPTTTVRPCGPILSVEQHIELLRADPLSGMPDDPHSRRFLETIVGVCHRVLANEGEAESRIIGGDE